jgi:hypothetical protein
MMKNGGNREKEKKVVYFRLFLNFYIESDSFHGALSQGCKCCMPPELLMDVFVYIRFCYLPSLFFPIFFYILTLASWGISKFSFFGLFRSSRQNLEKEKKKLFLDF